MQKARPNSVGVQKLIMLEYKVAGIRIGLEATSRQWPVFCSKTNPHELLLEYPKVLRQDTDMLKPMVQNQPKLVTRSGQIR